MIEQSSWPIAPADLADEHYQYAHMLRPTTFFRPDVAVLRCGDRPGS